MTQLLDGSHWKGDAAVAFREELRAGPLAVNLRNAAHSIRKAAGQLVRWEGELDDFQRRAGRLDADARDARDVLDKARGRASRAQRETVPGHDDAQKCLSDANAAVARAQADLDAVILRARRLAEEHEEKAHRRATKIQTATKKLAPAKPGPAETTLNWLTDNLPDLLSFTAGVIGVVALFVMSGGTLAAVLLLAAAVLSAGALTMRLSDPKVRASLADGFHGELDSDFWSNLVSVGGDIFGALPGIGAMGAGIRETVTSVRASGEVLPLGQRLALVGTKTMSEARAISGLENPVLDLVVRGARDPVKAGRVVEISSASLGVATAGYGLLSGGVEALDSDVLQAGGTGIDGVRSVLDFGGIIDLAGHVF
ncbi:hypothetical protein [Streptomyces sp. NPDC102462]|uniref:hypothetical protein n=1 Tax=Streptomyces sp. NPDC102462 TaxID=3366178 RepID=UPI0038113501